MALTLDGYDVVSKIGASPTIFPALKAELAKNAEALIKKQLKDKNLDLVGLRAVGNTLGEETIALVLELSKPAEVKSIAKKIDKHWVASVGNESLSTRRRLLDLAFGRTELADRPIRSTSRPTRAASAKPKAASPFGTSAMGVRRG